MGWNFCRSALICCVTPLLTAAAPQNQKTMADFDFDPRDFEPADEDYFDEEAAAQIEVVQSLALPLTLTPNS